MARKHADILRPLDLAGYCAVGSHTVLATADTKLTAIVDTPKGAACWRHAVLTEGKYARIERTLRRSLRAPRSQPTKRELRAARHRAKRSVKRAARVSGSVLVTSMRG